MRQEKIFKLLVLGFIVIMLILGSFIYGNIVRNKQNKQASQPNQNTTGSSDSKANTTNPNLPANANKEPNKPGQNAKTPTPAPVQQGTNQAAPSTSTPPQSSTSAPAPQPSGTIPNTGVELHYEAIPATIMATLGYIYIKQRKSMAKQRKQPLYI